MKNQRNLTRSTPTVTITNMTYINGTPINSGGTIEIPSGGESRVQFNVEVTTPSNLATSGNVYAMIRLPNGNENNLEKLGFLPNNIQTSYSFPGDITLTAASQTSGSSLFAQYQSSGGIDYNSSNSYTIEITDPPITNNTITGNQTINQGQSAATLNGSMPSGGNGSSYSYQWQRKTTGSWSNIFGGTSKNYSPGTLNETTRYRRQVSSGSQSSTSNEVTVTVTNLPPITNNTIGSNQTIDECEVPQTLIGTTPSGGDNSYSYQWQKNDNGSWSNISNSNTLNYSPPSLVSTTQYRRIVTSGSLTDTSNSVTVTVNYLPEIANSTISLSGTTVVGSTPTGGNGLYEYKYYFVVDILDGYEFNTPWNTNKDFDLTSHGILNFALSQGLRIGISRQVRSACIYSSNNNYFCINCLGNNTIQ